MTARECLSQFDIPQDLAGTSVEDTGWLLAAIYEQVLISRSFVIAQEREVSPHDVSAWSEQTIGCLEMEEVPIEECPCAPPSGCKWFRTIVDVPDPIGDFKAVTGIGGNLGKIKLYTYRDWFTIKYSLDARLEAERDRSYYTKKNRKIYVAGEGHGEPISITGIFYDPIEVQRLPACGGKVDDCKPFLDYEIFIDPTILNTVLGGAIKTLIGEKSVAKYDNTNNANPPNSIEGVKP